MAYCQHHQTHNCACAKEHADMGALYNRAWQAFDEIAVGMYRGFAFREWLMFNPEALEAAEKLAKLMKERYKG